MSDDIHKDLYDKINANTTAVAALAAARQRWADAKNNGNTTTTNITLRAGE